MHPSDDPLTGNLIDVTPTLPRDMDQLLGSLTDVILKHFFKVVQEASTPGDCIPNHSGSSLTSLTNAQFTHVFPQFSMSEHKYVLDLIAMG